MDEYGGEATNEEHIKPHTQDSEPPLDKDAQARTTRSIIRQTIALGSAVVVVMLLLPIFTYAGVFSAIAGVFSEEREIEQFAMTYNAQSVPLLKAAVHSDPNPSKGGGDIMVDESGALVPESGPLTLSGDAPRRTGGEISVYIVREADSLSQIAEMFDVSVNTILWANDIKSADLIRPGDTLVILPISGVRHIVKEGDTLKSIAKKYEGDVDDIVSYNQLASANDITPGQTVVIPGGEVEAPPAPVRSRAAYVPPASGGVSTAGYFANPLPGGVRSQGLHGYNGIDLAAPAGTPIRAAASGDVILVRTGGWNGGYGNYIVVRHPNGTQTLYAHNSSNIVSIGQRVVQGQVIGYVGNTGRSTGNHLHFEVRGGRNPF